MSDDRKVALITGITGQDGSYLTEFLLEKGYTVRCVGHLGIFAFQLSHQPQGSSYHSTTPLNSPCYPFV